MRNLALAGLLAMAVPLAMARTGVAQPSGAGPTEGSPTNLCQEFLAFMRAPAPGAARPAGGASAPGGAAPGGGERGESAQRLSGQGGVAVNAPEPNQASRTQEGPVQAAPQQSSRSAPVPSDSAGTPKERVMTVQEAEALAKANDMQACRNAVQRMRRAGVEMPPPLLARAALEPQGAPAR